jgi:hypothetical protein
VAKFREYLSEYKKLIKGEREVMRPEDLPPEHKARYDEAMAEVERNRAESRAASQAWKERQVLYGPALPEEPPDWEAMYLEQGLGAMMKDVGRVQREMLADTRQEIVDGFRPPKQIEDPVEREAAHRAELEARSQARAPYRAPDPPVVVISRIPTRGKTQLEELVAALQRSGLAARPDMVHGVYRVPDRISPNVSSGGESGRYVEWAVVHHPGALAPTAEPVDSAAFSREAQVIARQLGEPSVLDEEVGAIYCAMAGVGPEQCLGIARVPHFRRAPRSDAESGSMLLGVVTGTTVLHSVAPGAEAARARFAAEAPLRVSAPDGIHHEVLDWRAIGERVQLRGLYPPLLPSPLPYLPSSPEELLLAYLEVVGVQSLDCYGAQSTLDVPRVHSYAGGLTDMLGPKLPCADGKPRRRLHAGEDVVISYRDRPEYAAGRERWAAYQRDVLFARLDHATPKRPVLAQESGGLLLGVVNLVNTVAAPMDAFQWWLDGVGEPPDPSPFPYCWPPAAPAS